MVANSTAITPPPMITSRSKFSSPRPAAGRCSTPRQVRARDMIHRHSARCDNHRLPWQGSPASTGDSPHGLILDKQRGAINHIHVQLLKLALDVQAGNASPPPFYTSAFSRNQRK